MAAQPCISKKRDHEEFRTEERCFIIENYNTPLDESVSVATARVEPGVTTAWHRLIDTTERYVMLQGTGFVEIGEEPGEEINPGDVAFIPAGARQRIANRGSGQLVFLVICAPRFRPENYESLE